MQNLFRFLSTTKAATQKHVHTHMNLPPCQCHTTTSVSVHEPSVFLPQEYGIPYHPLFMTATAFRRNLKTQFFQSLLSLFRNPTTNAP